MMNNMGQGFSILVWDYFGGGLVMVNPRIISKGVDLYGNPNNWFSYHTEEEKNKLIEELTDGYNHFTIIE